MSFRPARLLLALVLPTPGLAAPAVVADIPPVQSIVAAVMDGLGSPALLLPPGASPHGAALRPSDAGRLQSADIVFWIGPALTPWLAEPLAALAPDATVITLAEADGVAVLAYREDAEAEHEGHAAEDHADAHDHDHDGLDPHLWLDPANGAAIARAAAGALAAADPANAGRYAANADAFVTALAAQSAELDARLRPFHDAAFLVFHDAYQYFERRFGLTSAGSISSGDADRPGAAHIAALRERIAEDGVACVFAEPEFEPRLVATVIEGTDARAGRLDGLGVTLEPGPGLYPALLATLAEDFAACLAP